MNNKRAKLIRKLARLGGKENEYFLVPTSASFVSAWHAGTVSLKAGSVKKIHRRLKRHFVGIPMAAIRKVLEHESRNVASGDNTPGPDLHQDALTGG